MHPAFFLVANYGDRRAIHLTVRHHGEWCSYYLPAPWGAMALYGLCGTVHWGVSQRASIVVS